MPGVKKFRPEPETKQEYLVKLFFKMYRKEISKKIETGYIDSARLRRYLRLDQELIDLAKEMGIEFCTCCECRPKKPGLRYLCAWCYENEGNSFDDASVAGGYANVDYMG